MGKTVQRCANTAFGRYKFFGIKFYGECWAGGESAAKHYFSEGESTACHNGTGDGHSIYIYHFGPAGNWLKIYFLFS